MNLSIEIRLMIACARVRVDGAVEKDIRELAKGIEDWDNFVRLCIEHKVLPLVFQNISVIGEMYFPDDLRRQVEDSYVFENAVHNVSLIFTAENLSQ